MWETRTESEALCANVGEDHSQPNTSTSPSAAGQSPSPTSKEPYPSESMPSDGYYNMGGIDGKDWESGSPTGRVVLLKPVTAAAPCSTSHSALIGGA